MLDKIYVKVKYCKILSCVQTKLLTCTWAMTQEEALATNEVLSQQ